MMTGFPHTLTLALSVLTILLLVGAAVALFALFSRSGFGARIKEFLAPKTLVLAFLVALGGVVGSLLYSNVVGYAPCELCWYQRIFLYPQAILFAIALWRNDRKIAPYGIALSIFGAVVALYHSYVQLGGGSVLPCTAAGAECAKVYFVEWGFITIPFMSLAAFVAIICFLLLYRKADRAPKF